MFFKFFSKVLGFVLISLFCFSTQAVEFSSDCSRNSILVSAVGDILLHTGLQSQGETYGYRSLWQEAIPYFSKADVSYANLEGSIDPTSALSNYPNFNYGQALATDLVASGKKKNRLASLYIFSQWSY